MRWLMNQVYPTTLDALAARDATRSSCAKVGWRHAQSAASLGGWFISQKFYEVSRNAHMSVDDIRWGDSNIIIASRRLPTAVLESLLGEYYKVVV